MISNFISVHFIVDNVNVGVAFKYFENVVLVTIYSYISQVFLY